jgi:cell division protein FtsL
MSEQVFGLSINQIMAYTAIANVLLVVVLAAVNIYYAGHAKRQADAAREQVNASNRQSEIAAETLSLVRKQMDQQVRTDLAAVINHKHAQLVRRNRRIWGSSSTIRSTVSSGVRRLRSSLKVEHGRILRQPPRPFDLKSAKSGQLATDVADPVFIIVTYERGARDKGECNPVQIAICKGEHALMKRIKSAGAGMTSTVMEVAAAAHSFHNTLLQTQPSRRGRPSS